MTRRFGRAYSGKRPHLQAGLITTEMNSERWLIFKFSIVAAALNLSPNENDSRHLSVVDFSEARTPIVAVVVKQIDH